MKQLEFTGSGTEYFKIWIVNILLSLLTLGIYYPWARVRNNRYLYSNSILQERNFEYHATGKQLLIGYLIAVFFFFIYKSLEFISPMFSLLLLGFFFVLIPWLIWRSMKFNLNVTSFNNVRFKFKGGLKDSYIIFLLVPILSLLAIAFITYLTSLFKNSSVLLGFFVFLSLIAYLVIFSYFNVIKTRYLIEYTSYGYSDFNTNIDTPDFIKIILKATGIGILAFLISAIIVAICSSFLIDFTKVQTLFQTLQNDKTSTNITLILQLIYPILILGYFCLIIVNVISFAYYTTELRAYIFENTNIENNVFFQSKMKFLPYATILITNFLLILFTLGLAYPWAKVRIIKYSLENTNIYARNGFDGYLNQDKKDKSGLADQMSDTLDIDIGIPL